MISDRQFWREWASALKHWGILDGAASILETVGPLSILAAQLIYLVQPLTRWLTPLNHVDALAAMLEEPERTRQFVEFLRGRSQ